MTIVTILHLVIPKLKILNHWSKKSSGPVGWVVEIRIKAQLSSAKLATGTELGNILNLGLLGPLLHVEKLMVGGGWWVVCKPI